MCTRPITIKKKTPFGIKVYTVPCGKCAECVNKKRSELAALSVHQALESGSCSFFTLTYDNEHCPVSIYDPASERIIGFERGVSDWMGNGRFENSLHYGEDGYIRAASLCREDVKKWLKLFRTRWSRKHPDKPLKFKYCFFGEYGDRQGRPHFHGLFYGLSPEQVDFASGTWTNGFVAVVPENDRKVTIDEIQAISQYVSKYISKGINQRFAFLLDYVEKPRRQSSIDFGSFSPDEIERYSNFIMGAIYCWLPSPADYPDALLLLNYVNFLIGVHLSRSLENHLRCHKL